jgi:hypothetical protein
MVRIIPWMGLLRNGVRQKRADRSASRNLSLPRLGIGSTLFIIELEQVFPALGPLIRQSGQAAPHGSSNSRSPWNRAG